MRTAFSRLASLRSWLGPNYHLEADDALGCLRQRLGRNVPAQIMAFGELPLEDLVERLVKYGPGTHSMAAYKLSDSEKTLLRKLTDALDRRVHDDFFSFSQTLHGAFDNFDPDRPYREALLRNQMSSTAISRPFDGLSPNLDIVKDQPNLNEYTGERQMVLLELLRTAASMAGFRKLDECEFSRVTREIDGFEIEGFVSEQITLSDYAVIEIWVRDLCPMHSAVFGAETEVHEPFCLSEQNAHSSGIAKLFNLGYESLRSSVQKGLDELAERQSRLRKRISNTIHQMLQQQKTQIFRIFGFNKSKPVAALERVKDHRTDEELDDCCNKGETSDTAISHWQTHLFRRVLVVVQPAQQNKSGILARGLLRCQALANSLRIDGSALSNSTNNDLKERIDHPTSSLMRSDNQVKEFELQPTVSTAPIYLRLFKSIRCNALHTLLPSTSLKITSTDRALLLLTVAAGSALPFLRSSSFAMAHPGFAEAAIGSVVLMGILNVWWGVSNRRAAADRQLLRALYFSNIANNRAVLDTVLRQARKNQAKRMLLLYYWLLTVRVDPHHSKLSVSCSLEALHDLQNQIQGWVQSQWDVEMDVEILETLRLLNRLGLVEGVDEQALLRAHQSTTDAAFKTGCFGEEVAQSEHFHGISDDKPWLDSLRVVPLDFAYKNVLHSPLSSSPEIDIDRLCQLPYGHNHQ